MQVIRYNKELYLKLLKLRRVKTRKLKLHRHRHSKDDLLFRFQKEGRFLHDYYVSQEDALEILKQDNNRIIHQDDKEIVLQLDELVMCIIR